MWMRSQLPTSEQTWEEEGAAQARPRLRAKPTFHSGKEWTRSELPAVSAPVWDAARVSMSSSTY